MGDAGVIAGFRVDTISGTTNLTQTPDVPEPSTLLFAAAGLVGVAAIRRR